MTVCMSSLSILRPSPRTRDRTQVRLSQCGGAARCLLLFVLNEGHLVSLFLGVNNKAHDERATQHTPLHKTTTRAIGTLYPRLVMHILTHILLICLWLDVVWAQASAPGPSPAQKTNNEDLSELALWPDVDIRGCSPAKRMQPKKHQVRSIYCSSCKQTPLLSFPRVMAVCLGGTFCSVACYPGCSFRRPTLSNYGHDQSRGLLRI